MLDDSGKADAAYDALPDSRGGKVTGTDIVRDLLRIAREKGITSLAGSPEFRKFAAGAILAAGGEATEEAIDQLTGTFLNAAPDTNLADAWENAMKAGGIGALLGTATAIASTALSGGDPANPTGTADASTPPIAGDSAGDAGLQTLHEDLRTAGIEVREELDRRSEGLWDRISDSTVPTAPVEETAADPAAAAASATELQAAGLPVMTSREDGSVQIDYPDRASELLPGQEEAGEALRRWEDNRSAEVIGEIRASLDSFKRGPGESSGTAVQPDADPLSRGDQAAKSEAIGQRVWIAAPRIGAELRLDAADLKQMPVLGSSPETFAESNRSIVEKM
ncbi:hypothetical protein [Luteolibacter sp. Populi]|uniref:hypothetical protein n=1 Tax=Luteolibacter sp. Populi TaxID=3230487 RepID=UPI003464F432